MLLVEGHSVSLGVTNQYLILKPSPDYSLVFVITSWLHVNSSSLTFLHVLCASHDKHSARSRSAEMVNTVVIDYLSGSHVYSRRFIITRRFLQLEILIKGCTQWKKVLHSKLLINILGNTMNLKNSRSSRAPAERPLHSYIITHALTSNLFNSCGSSWGSF